MREDPPFYTFYLLTFTHSLTPSPYITHVRLQYPV